MPLLVYSQTHFWKKLVFLGERSRSSREKGWPRRKYEVLEGNHKAVRTELDVLTHETRALTKKSNRDSIMQELMFNVDSITDDHTDATRRSLSGRQDNCVEDIAMLQAFITADQLV
jgi:hypothetical protein